jgi:periplasmic protein TonB
MYNDTNIKGIHKVKFILLIKYLFGMTLTFSILLHGSIYITYYIATHKEEAPETVMDSNELKDLEVDIQEIPPELLSPKVTNNPAPVEKQEWVEGKSKNGKEPETEDINLNAISGDGTDKDGYLFSFKGDKLPSPIVDFDLRAFFPEAAKKANITDKTVVMLVQIDETGKMMGAKIVSGKAGYGFDEAAMEIIKRVKFTPGYFKGKPTRMAHRLPITFSLED